MEAAAPVPIAVAVVSWNTRELLRDCLASLQDDARSGRAEVWVVDNASEDGSAAMARTEFPWARVIASDENLGFGRAVNLVARRTTHPWLAIANADTAVFPGALPALVRAGAADAGAGILAPRLVLPDGRTQHSVYHFPTLPFALAFNLGAASLGGGVGSRMLLEGHWAGERGRRVDWAIGAFLLVRRTAWEAAGGFDPAQWMYAEDLDLGWRVARAGWRTRFVPEAQVRHHGAAATSQLWGDDRDVRWQRSTYSWMLRRRGMLRTRAYALLNTAGAAVRAVWIAPLARRRGGEWRERQVALMRWTRLHGSNLVASRAELEAHR